jgi:DNA-binding MarR family transcriptional regulator
MMELSRMQANIADPLIHDLAELRFEMRRFMNFSEGAAIRAGLQPQQHQLLLQVAGAHDAAIVTIAYAAERLGLKHNSTVELVDRSVREGLLSRTVDAEDKRRAILHITRKGRAILARLAGDHAIELKELAPRLVLALQKISAHVQDSSQMESR